MSFGANNTSSAFPLDQTDDHSRRRSFAACRACGLDEKLLEAADDTLGIAKTAALRFAVGPGGTFKAHTKEATILSYALLAASGVNKNTAPFAKVAGELVKRAKFFRCESTIEAIDKHLKAAVRIDSDNDYAFVYKSGAETVRRLRLVTDDEIATADQWIIGHRRELAADDARTMAKRAVAAATAKNLPVSEGLQKLAGCGEFLRGTALEQLDRRTYATKQRLPEVSQCCASFREKLASKDPLLGDVAETTFEFLSTVDAAMEKKGISTAGLLLPEDVAFGGTAAELRKLAKAFLCLGDGTIYDANDVANRIDLSEVESRFGEKLAGELTNGIAFDPDEAAGVLLSLKGKDAADMSKILHRSNIRPLQKASSRPFAPSNIRKLANATL